MKLKIYTDGSCKGNGSSNSDNKENDKVVEENKDKEETKEENTPPVLTKESKVVIDLFNIFQHCSYFFAHL